MEKIMTIFESRPEAIKMAPLVKALEQEKNARANCLLLQHSIEKMLDSVLSTFEIKPKYDLNIMKSGQTLSEITSKSITQLEQVIQLEKNQTWYLYMVIR